MTSTLPASEDLRCGCDLPDPGQGALIPVDEAIRRGVALARQAAAAVTSCETLPLDQAHGRIAALPVRSRRPLPGFDNSAMDGYALRLADLSGDGPWRLPVAGRVAAGDTGGPDWPAGTALRILTGALVPADCGAVVMQEAVSRLDDGSIILRRRPLPGENIRRKGEDLPARKTLIEAGRRLDPRAMALLAAAGEARASVRPRVRVALFSTGSELREAGDRLAPGQIWNANRHHLSGALALPWVDLWDLGIVPDDPGLLAEMLHRAAWGADLVISTGGVSVGDEDHMPAVLKQAGAAIHVMKLAMKPGKPLTIGQVGRAIYVGLPGNPVSAFVTWHVIGARIAETLAGIARPSLGKIMVRAAFGLSRKPGRCEFMPARLTGRHQSGLAMAELVKTSVSHRVALLASSDGLLVIPAETDSIRPDDYLDFIPF